MPAEEKDKIQKKLDAVSEQLKNAKRLLGERNVTYMKLLRQLDAIPGNSELNQYQRRFTELCTQGLCYSEGLCLFIMIMLDVSFWQSTKSKPN